MNLSELLCDPFDPSCSLQLNNKYWPGDRFGLINVISDAEAIVTSGKLVTAVHHLKRLKKFFVDERVFSKFLFRLHRLHSFRSQFGYVMGRMDIPDEAVKANQYRGPETRASYALARVQDFGSLKQDTVKIYTDEYGIDLLRTNCTARFAKPDERQADITGYGSLSDYHNDELKGISAIVYLTDVRDENGAFSFIVGSHLVPRSLVLTAIHQCVEWDMGLNTPEKLSCVPLEFRGSVGIGNFLDREKADVVYRFRKVLEGGVGTFIIFNGQYVLHRGGKPITGSRTAAFFQPEGLLRHKLRSAVSRFFGLTRS